MIRPFALLLALSFTAAHHAAQAQTLKPFRSSNAVTEPQRYGRGVVAHLIEADNLMTQRDFDLAITVYDRAVVQDPAFADAYMKRGIAKFKLGRAEEGRQDIQRARRLNPHIDEIYGYPTTQNRMRVMAFDPFLGAPPCDISDEAAYWRHLTDSLAAPIISASLDASFAALFHPGDSQRSARLRALLWRAIDRLESGEPDLALREIDSALEGHEKSAVAHYLRAEALYRLDRIDEAARAAEEALRLDARFGPAHQISGRLFQAQGRWEAALRAFESAEKLTPGIPCQVLRQAQTLQRLGRGDLAANLYDRLLERKGEDAAPEWLLQSGAAKLMSGDVLGALSDVDDYFRSQAPQRASAHALRGNAYLLLNRYLEAIDEYTRAIELAPEMAESYHNRAIARILAYNHPDACVDFDRAARLGLELSMIKRDFFCNF